MLCGAAATASASSSATPASSAAQTGSATPAQAPPVNQGLPIPYPTDVLTYHYNVYRQGATTQETTLTPSNVNFNTFGKINFFTVDGKVDAQPLFVNKQSISGSLNDTVLCRHRERQRLRLQCQLRQAILARLRAWAREKLPATIMAANQISPQIGITDTPVIDKGNGPNGAIYFVAMSKDSSGNYYQRLHAFDLTTGAELFGGPVTISATYPGTGDGSQNGQVIFAPGQFAERAAILEYGGTLYISFTSHCDSRPYTGWIMAYNSRTLAQTSVIDVTPNGSKGAIWMSGEGLAADSSGNIYFLDGNGTFDTTLNSQGFPSNGDYGNAFMKLSTSGGTLAVADYFNMYDTVQESDNDEDLGSGGAIVLPDLMDNNGIRCIISPWAPAKIATSTS